MHKYKVNGETIIHMTIMIVFYVFRCTVIAVTLYSSIIINYLTVYAVKRIQMISKNVTNDVIDRKSCNDRVIGFI